ncbi:MAG: hypothetical protein IJ719_02345 [Clostridia bacterium]|nr:hypothetical protein [Clostridia bacterium]
MDTSKRKPLSSFLVLLPWTILLLCYLFSILSFYRFGSNKLNGDLSSEMVMADFFNKEHTLLSKNWYYSTGLTIASSIPAFQLGLLLFSSWHMARTFAIALLMAGCIIAFLYAAFAHGKQPWAIYAVCLLTLPLGEAYAFILPWGGFYSMSLILACVLYGLIERYIRKPRYQKKLYLFFILLISFWYSLKGVRIFMEFTSPYCLVAFLPYIRRYFTASLSSNPEETEMEHRRFFVLAISTIVSFVGCIINFTILSKQYYVTNYSDTAIHSFSLLDFIGHFESWKVYLGFRPNVPLFSLKGILALGCLCFPVIMLILCIWDVFTRKDPTHSFACFALCGCFTGVLINCTFGQSSSEYHISYYLVAFLFMVTYVFCFIWNRHCHKLFGHILCCLLCFFFILVSVDYIRTSQTSTKTPRQKAVEWLVENNYTIGYATFWDGHPLTEESDGSLEIIVYETWAGGEPYKWLQSAAHITQVPDQPVFVYTDIDEQGFIPFPGTEDHLVYNENGVYIYAYDSGIEVNQILSDYHTTYWAQQ